MGIINRLQSPNQARRGTCPHQRHIAERQHGWGVCLGKSMGTNVQQVLCDLHCGFAVVYIDVPLVEDSVEAVEPRDG